MKDLIYEVVSQRKNVKNFQIKTDSIYKLTDKYDPNAPSGFEKEGAKKLPSEGIEDMIQANFVEDRSHPSGGLWDTGLYEESPCYKNKDPKEVEEIVTRLQKYLVTPYKKIYSRTNDLGHEDDKFWNHKLVKIYKGRAFNTSNAGDLLDLYIALQTGSITPDDFGGDPRYEDSYYKVVDNSRNTEYKKEKASVQIDAFMNFGKLLVGNKKKLNDILYYINLNVSSKMDDETLKYTFNEHLGRSAKNASEFNDLVKSIEKDSTMETKLFIYRKLKEMYKEGVVVKKIGNGKFTYNNTVIGSELKNAAEDINTLEKFKEIKTEIVVK